jgi:hypothetical protein
MRAARWQYVIVVCSLAACGVDPATSYKSSAVVVDCRQTLLRQCVAMDCQHRCNDDMVVPEGHVIYQYACPQQSATTCSVTYATCDPETGIADPTPAPIFFSCGPDQCPPEHTVPCQASCGLNCAADIQTQVPSGSRVISATCDLLVEGRCAEEAVICDSQTGLTSTRSSALSCPIPCGPTQTQIPCTDTQCGHDCAADAAAKVPPGERIIGSSCLSRAAFCSASVTTCDGNGNQHNYSAGFDDPTCGDPCHGDPCCGDPCCGDPCCGDPCCGDPCCGDPCCGDPCCGDPCCGDPFCGGYGCRGDVFCELEFGSPVPGLSTPQSSPQSSPRSSPRSSSPMPGATSRRGVPGAAALRYLGQPASAQPSRSSSAAIPAK